MRKKENQTKTVTESRKISVEELRLRMLRDYIDENKESFKPGKKLNTEELNTLFGTPLSFVYSKKKATPAEIVAAYRLHLGRRVAWQNRMNRLLAQRGLYMSIRDE